MSDKRSLGKSRSRAGVGPLRQYILAGAGLGLYFGLFFRPVREPNLAVALSLALLATAVMSGITLFRKDRPPLTDLGKTAVATFIKFFLILLLLEARHYAYDLGGKWLVTIFTTLLGAGAGWWLATNNA